MSKLKKRKELCKILEKWFTQRGMQTSLFNTMDKELEKNNISLDWTNPQLHGRQSFINNKKEPLVKNVKQYLQFISEQMNWDISILNQNLELKKKLGNGSTLEKENPIPYRRIEPRCFWGKDVVEKRIFSAVIKGSRDQSLRYTRDFKWANKKKFKKNSMIINLRTSDRETY